MGSTDSNRYDYAIVGMGAAGLNLALAMANTELLAEKRIALIDRSIKDQNDHTWCYWDHQPSRPPYISKSWTIAEVYGLDKEIRLNLDPYQYNMVRSRDFYSYSDQVLKTKKSIDIIIGSVEGISEDKSQGIVVVDLPDKSIEAGHVFDSRLSDDRDTSDYVNLVQHFKGVRIKTNEPVFDPESFVMMDYRYKDGSSCSFMYVLPDSTSEALLEFTYFNEHVVDEEVYDAFIENYIREELKISDYQIVESEMGRIPMSTYPFESQNSDLISKIGTAGGWVKPSSGYSFRNAQKNAMKIVENILAGRSYAEGLFSARHRWYDKIMLKVLRDRNELGERLFTDLYSKRSIHKTFRFLDEESSLIDDLAIISAFPPAPFIKAVVSS